MVRLSLGRQFCRSFLGQILLIIPIVPGAHALADSASAPLAVPVVVVRSCNVATALPLVAEEMPADARIIKPDQVVTLLCPRGFNPGITVNSGNYASDVAMTRTRFSAANKTHSGSSEPSPDQPTVKTHRNRVPWCSRYPN
jgi:hypothetical protein